MSPLLAEVRQRFQSSDNSKQIIEADTKFINQLWLNTFRYNSDPATDVLRLMLASVQKAELSVRSIHASEWQPPVPHLAASHYLSHGARIIYDLANLSSPNREKFYQYLHNCQLAARESTHGLIRTPTGKLVEGKGFEFSDNALLEPAIATDSVSPNRGVNLAIGGIGQKNLIGKTVQNNGFSGHLSVHIPNYQPSACSIKECLLGIEQVAPIQFWTSCDGDDIQFSTDQFGNQLNLAGASDPCTAFGTLYFTDPLYIRVYADCFNDLPPQKYGGIKVTILDEHWPLITKQIDYFSRGEKIKTSLLDEMPTSSLLYQTKAELVEIPPKIVHELDLQMEQVKENIADLILEYLYQLRCNGEDPRIRDKINALLLAVQGLDQHEASIFDELLQDKSLTQIMSGRTGHVIKVAHQLVMLEHKRVQQIHKAVAPILNSCTGQKHGVQFQEQRQALYAQLAELQLEYAYRLKQQPDCPETRRKATGLIDIIRSLDNPRKDHALLSLQELSKEENFAAQEHQTLAELIEQCIKLIELELAQEIRKH